MPNTNPRIYDTTFLLRLTKSQKRQIAKRAKATGYTQAEYVRRLLLLSDVPKSKKGGK